MKNTMFKSIRWVSLAFNIVLFVMVLDTLFQQTHWYSMKYILLVVFAVGGPVFAIFHVFFQTGNEGRHTK